MANPRSETTSSTSRRSEIDAINGMVPVVAREVATEAPYNEVVTALVRAREAQF